MCQYDWRVPWVGGNATCVSMIGGYPWVGGNATCVSVIGGYPGNEATDLLHSSNDTTLYTLMTCELHTKVH